MSFESSEDSRTKRMELARRLILSKNRPLICATATDLWKDGADVSKEAILEGATRLDEIVRKYPPSVQTRMGISAQVARLLMDVGITKIDEIADPPQTVTGSRYWGHEGESYVPQPQERIARIVSAIGQYPVSDICIKGEWYTVPSGLALPVADAPGELLLVGAGSISAVGEASTEDFLIQQLSLAGNA